MKSHRAKPFSGKKKKEQLQLKKMIKKSNAALGDFSDSDKEKDEKTTPKPITRQKPK